MSPPKWVDNFNFMHEPCGTVSHDDGSKDYIYAYDLGDIIQLMDKLGILWHPIDKKGHDFTFLATYVGFDWDLQAQTVSLPECQHKKYAVRVSAYLDAEWVSLEETMKIHGTLQHMTFILMSSSSYLPSISRVIMGFKGDIHHHHHRSHYVHVDLLWWRAVFSEAHIGCYLLPPLHWDPDVWVDASTSWGIG